MEVQDEITLEPFPGVSPSTQKPFASVLGTCIAHVPLHNCVTALNKKLYFLLFPNHNFKELPYCQQQY